MLYSSKPALECPLHARARRGVVRVCQARPRKGLRGRYVGYPGHIKGISLGAYTAHKGKPPGCWVRGVREGERG